MNILNLTFKYGLLILAFFSFSMLRKYNNTNQQQHISQFQEWKQKFNIKYDTYFENLYRQKLYFAKKIIIQIHNANPNRNYDRGFNQFSALTKDQFKLMYLTYQHNKNFNAQKTQKYIENFKPINANIDWRTQGAVGPIKEQGKCGSCWAFSTVAGLQAASKVFYGTLKSFSEQQLVDCDLKNRGCVGGQMRLAIDYVKNHGSLLESEYPYKGVRQICKKPNGSFFVSGHTDVTGCTNLANALTARPLVVGVDANSWDDYKSGIFDNCINDKDVFNHGVLLIGMTSDYWIIKNSFGVNWGQSGFMRLAAGDTCNICDDGIMIQK